MNGIRNNAANVLRHVTSDDRVHPQFLPFQSTGRWSVTPGMTVLKKGVEDSEREFFLPEEGHVLVSVDLDQIDIRTVAGHSQDPALIALLSDPGRDIHTEIAELSCTPRKEAKTIDLGWMYARSANAMSQMPGMSRESAERVCDYMSSAFPRVVEFQRRTRERGAAGEILDNGFGRRLRVQQDRAYTQSVAMIGQSATRDIIGEGLIDLARRAPEMLPMLRMIVHDEVVASVPEKDAEECARMIQDCLSRQWVPNGCSIPVSITAGQGKPFVFGRTWGELYR
jgi:DNA polymerase I-like protein with 3'-5' exonuclease and polymerase domains